MLSSRHMADVGGLNSIGLNAVQRSIWGGIAECTWEHAFCAPKAPRGMPHGQVASCPDGGPPAPLLGNQPGQRGCLPHGFDSEVSLWFIRGSQGGWVGGWVGD